MEYEDRIALWLAMADHFLDTETRQDIPATALGCVQAGLSTQQAFELWRHEVSPAVAANLYSVAGEWAGWNRDWLVARIERARTRRALWPSALRWLLSRSPIHFNRGVWLAIERCMETLLQCAPSEARQERVGDLSWLAHHYFDVPSGASAEVEESRLARLRALYPEPFRWLMAPALVSGEEAEADRRLRRALGLA